MASCPSRDTGSTKAGNKEDHKVKAIIKIIPNTITCCNLISGCIATTFALKGMASMALTWIIIGAVFDFFDGMSARLLKVSSPIGKELDSLADDVTFGVAPASIIFAELKAMEYPLFMEPWRDWLPYAAFIVAAFSALRLAKFNLDERQTTSFIGLPTPANALLWGSLIATRTDWIENTAPSVMVPAMLIFICVSSLLLVCELPMFALKFKHWGWKGNELKYCFAAGSVVTAVIMGPLDCFWVIILAYILISIFKYFASFRSVE